MIAILFVTIFTAPAFADGLLKKVDLSLCSSKTSECIAIKAESAKESSFQRLFFMKEPVVQKKGSNQKTYYSSGYLDFDNNRLVLRNKKSEFVTEEVLINLDTLQKQTFVMK